MSFYPNKGLLKLNFVIHGVLRKALSEQELINNDVNGPKNGDQKPNV